MAKWSEMSVTNGLIMEILLPVVVLSTTVSLAGAARLYNGFSLEPP